jgi:ribose-phosphate pyrophosphokinase
MIGDQIKLFAGSATHDLAQNVADHLGLQLAQGNVTQFPDGESRVLVEESVRGCDCYIIQSTCAPVNHNIMELLVFIDALRRASAWRINAVIPYFGYARQDKKVQAREPITAKLVANMLEKAGIHRVITIFDVPVDHLTALDILSGYLKKTDLSQSVIVSPDVGRATEGRRLANTLGVDLAILYKRRRSPTETEVSHVIGEVNGKRPIMIDDMISTAGTVTRAVDALIELGSIPEITLAATHPVFIPPAIDRLAHPAIKEVVVTDTIPYQGHLGKINVLSVAPLLASAIRNVHDNQSVSQLFSELTRG